MEELIDYILQFGTLNTQQLKLLTRDAIEIDLQKDRYFSKAGKIPRQVGFIKEQHIQISENKAELEKCIEANLTQILANCRRTPFRTLMFL